MSENYSFRSAMNGFNRNDVISYIDVILGENAINLERIAVLETQLQAETDKNAYLNQLLIQAKENESKTNVCSECDIAKVYEARLGAAMLDAKRFSEIIVKEANDKASELFENALSSAEDTSKSAKEIASDISKIRQQFDFSLNALYENMILLSETLDMFKSDVKSTGEKYDFTTDFLPIKENLLFDEKNEISKENNSDFAKDEESMIKDPIKFNDSSDLGKSGSTDSLHKFNIRIDL